jgi:peptidoglycan/xylan/chitin deacetylase (PgdA/CDA1 family)
MITKKTKGFFLILLMTGVLFASLSTLSVSFAETTSTWDPSLGWDFQCHTHTHPNLQGLTAVEIQWEMEQVDAAFQAQGYSPPNHHAYPYGDYDDDVKAVIAEYRLNGRMVWGFMMNYPIVDWYEVKAAQLKRTTSWNRITGWVEDCIADQALLHIFTHEVSESADQYGCKPEKLAQVLDHLLEKQNAGLLEIVTMAEAYDYWSTATEGKAMVVVSFDDAYETDYTTVFPMFQERGLKGTSYIVTSWIGEPDYLTWEMIDEMRGGTHTPKPDFTLTANDIAFTPEAPSEGEEVTISATIHNTGDEGANNIVVDFYDGQPSVENLIGSDTIPSIDVGASAVASTSWTTIAGNHDIFVVIDPNNAISESNENNNEASKPLTIGGGGSVLHVENIDMSWSSQSKFYTAYATITIVDDNDSPTEGATVYGSWSGAYTGDVSGVTNASGQVTLHSRKVKDGGTFTFTVTDVVQSGSTYEPSKNVETSDSITCP